MTTGQLKIGGALCELTPGGWASEDADTAADLNEMFPIESGPVGDPLCRTFAGAVRALGKKAAVVRQPKPDPSPPGTVH